LSYPRDAGAVLVLAAAAHGGRYRQAHRLEVKVVLREAESQEGPGVVS